LWRWGRFKHFSFEICRLILHRDETQILSATEAYTVHRYTVLCSIDKLNLLQNTRINSTQPIRTHLAVINIIGLSADQQQSASASASAFGPILLAFPSESHTPITSFLDPPSILALSRVCRELYEHIKNDTVRYHALTSPTFLEGAFQKRYIPHSWYGFYSPLYVEGSIIGFIVSIAPFASEDLFSTSPYSGIRNSVLKLGLLTRSPKVS
jgi:hypothetical protein